MDNNRDDLGRLVREAWVKWALTQDSPKPSWLVPYDELAECDKEADRQIGEAIFDHALNSLRSATDTQIDAYFFECSNCGANACVTGATNRLEASTHLLEHDGWTSHSPSYHFKSFLCSDCVYEREHLEWLNVSSRIECEFPE